MYTEGYGDNLTGLANRAALDGTLTRSLAKGDNVALAVLDVDSFREINATLGNDVGDRLLQELAALLTGEQGGEAYRLSGDEFAVLLPDLTLEQAFLRMEALRARIAALESHEPSPFARRVTITVGVAQFPRDAKDVAGLLKAADAALLWAKENGRNQVGLPPNEDMVMKSCYYAVASVRKLKALAERTHRKESHLLREALNDLLRKYDTPQGQ